MTPLPTDKILQELFLRVHAQENYLTRRFKKWIEKNHGNSSFARANLDSR